MEPDPPKYIRVLTWNCRRATQNSQAWKYAQELSPDLMLLQEVSGISSQIKEDFDVRYRSAIGKTGNRQRFGSVVAVRGEITREIPLQSTYDWVNKELELFSGNIMACEVTSIETS